jgi:ribosomal protein S27E
MTETRPKTARVTCDNCGDTETVDARHASTYSECERCRDAAMRDRLLRAFETGDDDVFSRERAAQEFEQDARPGKFSLPATLPSGDVLLAVEVGRDGRGEWLKRVEKLLRRECDCGCGEARESYELDRYGGRVHTIECNGCGKMHKEEYVAP